MLHPEEPKTRLHAVAELAAQGQTDREIAEELGISAHTVDTYWRRLRQRYGVRRRAEVVVHSLQEGLERQREAFEEERQRLGEKIRSLEALQADLLTKISDLQRREALSQRSREALELFERASWASRTLAYEISSLDPIVHRAFSASCAAFGIDAAETISGKQTFYDLIVPEDLREIQRIIAQLDFEPDRRYFFLFRALTPEPRWMLDRFQPLYDDSRAFSGLIGMNTDVQELVEVGLLPARVVAVVDQGPAGA